MNTRTNVNPTTPPIALQPLPEETIRLLHKITSDSIDAMRLVADVYAISAFAIEYQQAEASGRPAPRMPKPHSKFLRGFVSHFKAWLETMGRELRPDELERLMRIGTAYAARIKDEPQLLLEELFTVVTMAPPFALLWLRAHFDEIEAKVVS